MTKSSGVIVKHHSVILLVLAYLVLGVAFSTTIPIYEAPDEPGHIAYIIHVIDTSSLPVQSIEKRNYAHHPPLYYVLAALPAHLADVKDVASMPRLRKDSSGSGQKNRAIHNSAETFPYSGRVLAIHLSRAVSVLCGAITLLITIAIGRLVFPSQRMIGFLHRRVGGIQFAISVRKQYGEQRQPTYHS